MRLCSGCGHPNADNTLICSNCAARLGQHCPACGQFVPIGNNYCGQCGTRQPVAPKTVENLTQTDDVARHLLGMMPTNLANKISVAASDIVGQRREVTVLFVDATDFTAAAHKLDSEDVYLLIDEAMRLLVQVVFRYEGTIDKFTGDGLMALFGAPVAHENDPERAVRAALEMQTTLSPLQEQVRQRHGFEFQIRIGIHTGEVIAGQVGSDLHLEYTVIGDTVNLAHRLEANAEPGTVLVSFATYQRTGPFFEFEPVAPLEVKGLPDPIQAFRPLGLRETVGQVRGLPGVQAPMIGREAALGRLHDALNVVRQQRHSQIILITGAAGVGKSRLVSEFRRSLVQPDVCIYQGSCLDYARSTPLWVASEALRDVLHIGDGDSATVQRETLQAYLEQMEIDSDQAAPYLINALGLVQEDPQVESRLHLLDTSTLQRQTHAALRQVFLAEAALSTTVLVFDDLHWVDPASKDFLEFLIRTTSDEPLLTMLVSRPAERETILTLLTGAAARDRERLIELQLQALSAADILRLADYLLQQWTPEAEALKQRIVARAEGNPFFTEEIVRMLIDHGALVGAPGAWRILPKADELMTKVPETLQGLILARYDRLDPGLRWTLQRAAVIGRSFPVALIQSLAGESPEPISAQLAELEARQFLKAEAFGSEPGYTFSHALIQESIYGTLLKRDRHRIHGRVAQAIEGNAFWSEDERVDALAHHYTRSENPANAVPFLVAAAEKSARQGANETAIQHYRQALTLMQEQPDYHSERFFRAQIGLGRALKFVGDFAEARMILSNGIQDLLRWSVTADHPTLLALAIESFTDLADVRIREGDYDDARANLDAGLKALGAKGAQEHPRLWRKLMERVAFVHLRQGRLNQAYAQANAAVAGQLPEHAYDPLTLASLYNTLGGVHWQQGNLSEAANYVQRSLELFQELGDAWGMANSYTNLGVLHYAQGVWRKAAANLERADVLRRDNGYMPERAVGLRNLGLVRIALGDHTQAQQDLEDSLSISQRLGEEYGVVLAEIGLALLAVKQSRFHAAFAHVEAAEKLSDAAGEDQAIQLKWLTALIRAAEGDPRQGVAVAEEALQMARAAGLWEEEADCLRVLGTLKMRAGAHRKAEASLRKSAELSQRQKDDYREAQALLDLGRLYQHMLRSGKNDKAACRSRAQTALEEAAHRFASLEAAYELEQARAALDNL